MLHRPREVCRLSCGHVFHASRQGQTDTAACDEQELLAGGLIDIFPQHLQMISWLANIFHPGGSTTNHFRYCQQVVVQHDAMTFVRVTCMVMTMDSLTLDLAFRRCPTRR